MHSAADYPSRFILVTPAADEVQLMTKKGRWFAMSETVPPVTTEEIRTHLKNPTFSVYMYVGKKTDKGWKVANAIYSLLARMRIYLVTDISLIEEFIGNRRPAGVVFGWDETPKAFLTKAQAEEFLKVFDVVTKAREG